MASSSPPFACQPGRHRGQRKHPVQDAGGPGQVAAALEERDRVDNRRAVRAGRRGQFVHGRDVGRGPGEADHVPVAGRGAEPLLHPGHRLERGQHLAGQRRQFRSAPQLSERPLVHRAVLPDLQAGQVKAERLGLPAQVLQLAERLPGRTRGGQRVLQHAQVGHEPGGPGVSQRGVGQPGGPQPPRRVAADSSDTAPGAPALLSRPAGPGAAGAAVRSAAARPGPGGAGGVEGQRPADPVRRGLQRAQRMVRAGSPRFPWSPGRSRSGCRPGPRPPSCPGGGMRARPPGPPRTRPRQRGFQAPVQPGQHPEEGLVEGGHDRADLVQRLHCLDPQHRGTPQKVGFLPKPPSDLGVLRRPRDGRRRARRAAPGSGAAPRSQPAAAPRSDAR